MNEEQAEKRKKDTEKRLNAKHSQALKCLEECSSGELKALEEGLEQAAMEVAHRQAAEETAA